MKISKNITQYQNTNKKVETNFFTNKEYKNAVNTKKINIENIPASTIRANYSPNFGKYRKIKTVELIDKDTEKPVKANITKENIGDWQSYKVMVKGKEAGYMTIKTDTVFPEENFVITEPTNQIPEIRNLRSLLGDKYRGIGSNLILCAIEESEKQKRNGALWLSSEKGYAYNLSPYRSNENPIPFYYNVGFKSYNNQIDTLIKECLSKSSYNNLPDSTILLLSSKEASLFKKYLCSHYAATTSSATQYCLDTMFSACD